MIAGRPILVTGSHRSGSTWTGKMIARSPKVHYLQEPFNEHYYDPGVCLAYFDTPFCYITRENEQPYFKHIQRAAQLKYNWLAAFQHAKTKRQLMRAAWRGIQFTGHRWRQHHSLFKDPFALLSAEWLVDRFNMIPVILIRHPAAFVSSLKRFGWESPVHLLRQQPLLMRDLLGPMTREMDIFLSEKRSLVEQGAQFWRLLYFVVQVYQERYPDWLFIRHEDLSLDPINQFRRVFDYLGLPYTADTVESIRTFTDKSNPDSSHERTTVAKLNSKANVLSWKKRLTPAEVDRIRRITGDVAEFFYRDAEWE